MSQLNQLYASFDKFNPSLGQSIVSVSKDDFCFNIRVSNSQIHTSSHRAIEKYFGQVKCKVQQIQGTHDVEIKVSRLELPKEAYSVTKVSKFIAEHASSKGLFLGVTSFGDYFLNFDNFTHGIVAGSSGYGKSVFFKNLLSQSLAFHHDVSNFIIDPKNVDFKHFASHPNVLGVYTKKREWAALTKTLLTELKFRMDVFNNSFDVPPTKLSEYRKIKSESHPHFQRIIVWIDEAHEIMTQTATNELSECFSYIARTGRSFGIHLMISSQKYVDIPSIIRSQATCQFHFYSSETNSLQNEYQAKWNAIPGRLYYYDRESNEENEIQTPYCDSNSSLAMAYNWAPNTRHKHVIYPLTIPEDLLHSPYYAASLRSGESLRNLNLINTYISSDKNYMTGYDLNFYMTTKGSEIKSYPTSNQNKPSNTMTNENKNVSKNTELQDDILNEFNNLLGNIDNKNVKESLPPKESVKIDIPYFKKINNEIDIKKSLKIFKKELDSQQNNLKWLQVDRSANIGLLSINKDREIFQKDEILDLVHGVKQLALSDLIQSRIQHYIEDTNLAFSKNEKCPLIIIEGPSGSGKRSILKNIAYDLNIEAVQANEVDLYSILKDQSEDFLRADTDKNHQTEKTNTKKRMILFDSPMSAIEFYKKSPKNIIVGCHHSPAPSFYGLPKIDYRYLQEPYLQIEINESIYMNEEIGSKLLRTLLKSLNYAGDKYEIRKFVAKGVSCLPSSLYQILKRARNFAYMKNASFNESFIDRVLEDFELAKKSGSEFVTKVDPKKDLDSIVLTKKNLDDLEETIFRIKQIEKDRLIFEKNLRKSNRLVAIFGGSPGTGKTMAAEVVAKECRKELWIVDFPSLQSAYVGETEKYIKKLFEQAQSAKCILLIDECDSLLKSRELTNTDHAKNWTNQLLRQLDEFAGIVILTTNYMGQLDSAISRRIDIKSEFQLPEKEEMIKIITNLLMPDAPLCKDLNLHEATEGISLSGGLIRNAIEKANFYLIKNNLKVFTTEILREALLATMQEDQLINPKTRTIGIA